MGGRGGQAAGWKSHHPQSVAVRAEAPILETGLCDENSLDILFISGWRVACTQKHTGILSAQLNILPSTWHFLSFSYSAIMVNIQGYHRAWPVAQG